jgi:hypothetical protein
VIVGVKQQRICLPLVRVVDALEADILLVLEETVEFGLQSVEAELRQDELNICADERTVS